MDRMMEYERMKRLIAETASSSDEYEARIKELVDRLKL